MPSGFGVCLDCERRPCLTFQRMATEAGEDCLSSLKEFPTAGQGPDSSEMCTLSGPVYYALWRVHKLTQTNVTSSYQASITLT